jgi:uncharacterized UBP type Zn finger protein
MLTFSLLHLLLHVLLLVFKQECGATSELWVCLICGFVGCGGRVTSGSSSSSSSSNSHINAHHVLTLHAYALDIETQQVSVHADMLLDRECL